MEIIIGKTAGFCAGVRNAVKKAEDELIETKEKIYCLGELVHNQQVVEKLENKGLNTIENIEDAKGKTIIRAHGIPKEIYEKARKNNIELIDLTCPKVLQIHKIAEEYSKKGYYIIFVGVDKHPEAIGTISFCGKNSYLLKDIEDVTKCIEQVKKSNNNKILVIAQTTYSLTKFEEIQKEIISRLKDNYEIEVKNTICTATKIRQEETNKISKEVEYMIIIGGKNSSNTKKLYEISKANCKNVISVEIAKDLNLEEIKKYKKIGIMAGASTPNESIEEIKQKIMEEINETKYSISRT